MISTNNSPTPRRVMLIGFDGATLDLIQPWAEAGILPTFQRLMTQAAWGSLQSTMPPVTPAAWSSLATGMNQGKHGLFDFFGHQMGSYETYLVNATHRHGASLWRLLSEARRRVTVFNVPATYPPEPVNGLMVSGLLTPTHATDATWPAELLPELKQAVPGFSFYPPGIFSQGQEVDFVQDVLNWDRMTLQATEFLMKRQNWDFLFTVFIGVDVISHFMWRHMVTAGASAPTNDPETKKILSEAIQSVYRQADEILARLLATADDDTYVAVVSDHGFGPLDYYMHLNAWLEQTGYLKFKRTLPVQLKALAYRLGLTPLPILELLRLLHLGGQVQQTASQHNAWLKSLVKKAFLSLADVDWSRTTAYSAGYGGPIFVNLKGREAQGTVEPGADYEALLARLTADLKSLRQPDTNAPFMGEIYRPQDLYSGPYTSLAPDLLAVPRDWCNQGYGVHDFASNRWLEPSPDRTGTHRMNGIFFLHGPDVKPGPSVEGASLWDVAPTILALMGVPIPQNMDGHVLSSAISETLLTQLSISYSEAVDDTPSLSPEMNSEEERIIRERLEALGYVS
jgi:predicted AlkP superfamily phosphohydrolase/phosphomutase